MTITELAAFLGVSRPRASQIIAEAREKGNPVTEPLTLPEQPHVALAIITSDQGVLVAKRRDGIPPWTFLGGEIQPARPPAMRCAAGSKPKAGLDVTAVHFIGRRIHPKTSGVMVYGHVEVDAGRAAARRPGGPGTRSGGPASMRRANSCRTCTGRCVST